MIIKCLFVTEICAKGDIWLSIWIRTLSFWVCYRAQGFVVYNAAQNSDQQCIRIKFQARVPNFWTLYSHFISRFKMFASFLLIFRYVLRFYTHKGKDHWKFNRKVGQFPQISHTDPLSYTVLQPWDTARKTVSLNMHAKLILAEKLELVISNKNSSKYFCHVIVYFVSIFNSDCYITIE
jgi:hypothetical protein